MVYWTPTFSKCFAAWFVLGLASAQTLPDGPGKDKLVKVCTDCHDLEQAVSVRLPQAGWKKMIDKMIERGAEGSDADFDVIIEYLTKNFSKDSKVNINKATPIDLELGLEVLRKEADAIVAYREQNGALKDWNDLMKVKGVDPKKLEAKKAVIVF